jgi:hypothetical protein
VKRLKVTRFLQDPCCCSIGSTACVANYYNKDIDYKFVKKLALKKVSDKIDDEGLESGDMGLLLNYLGFNKVSIVSTDLDIFDYSWSRLGKKALLENIKKMIKVKKEQGEGHDDYIRGIYKFLKRKDFNNKLIISHDFGKHIRSFLNRKKPVILTFNWNMFFKFPKDGEDCKPDPFNGEEEEHVVVAYGYTKRGVYICDSHHKYYKYRLKRFRRGYYHIPWEQLMTIMGTGDLFLPEDFSD